MASAHCNNPGKQKRSHKSNNKHIIHTVGSCNDAQLESRRMQEFDLVLYCSYTILLRRQNIALFCDRQELLAIFLSKIVFDWKKSSNFHSLHCMFSVWYIDSVNCLI